MDLASFRAWLELHLARWSDDPVFQQRARIRDIRREHPRFRELEDERRAARAAYAASPLYSQLETVRAELVGAERAVAGLSHALASATERAERDRLARRLADYQTRADQLTADLDALTAESPEHALLDRVSTELHRLREATGFLSEVERLEDLQRRQGRGSGKSGSDFERVAIESTQRIILPELGADPPGGEGIILRGVKLGAARTEFDQLVVQPAADPDAPVEVVAMVEVKRNPNDLAHGLTRRLENLAWLTGHRDGYDAEAYRTAAYPSGHFEGVGVHLERGRRFTFIRDSFHHFDADVAAGALPRKLYLVTRDGPLWGIGSAGLARIAHRVPSEMAWDLDNAAYLAELLAWCQRLTHEVEAPDVLDRYAQDEGASGNIVVLED